MAELFCATDNSHARRAGAYIGDRKLTPKQLGYEPQAWAGIMVMAWALIVVCIFFAGYVFLNFNGGY